MLRKMPVLLLPIALLSPTVGYGGLFGPSNYDECITDSMKGVSSDVAARAIIEACRNRFPESARVPDTPAATAPAATPEPAAAPAPSASPKPAAAADPVAPAELDTAGARQLTADELGRVRATAKIFGSTYRVTVVNDNPDLTLTEVTIAVWDDGDGGATRKEYSEAVRIAPQTSALVTYTVHYRGDETSWNWGIAAARGSN